MSFKGTVEARCPNGCEAARVDIWSFVRGDKDEALREAILAGELNMLVCLQCGGVFYPEATVVYCDPSSELVAFVFPESYEAEKERWRAKMHEDYEQMRKALAGQMPLGEEPLIFFGMDALRALLQGEDDLEDEVRVAEFLCRELGLRMQPVQRAFARRLGLPRLLPCSGAGTQYSFHRAQTLAGLESLLKANDRLAGYRRWREFLEGGKEAPPLKSGGRKL